MSKVKICGITRDCDVQALNQAMPDYAGFVFAESKRQVSAQKAWSLKASLDKDIKTVGVFVNEPLERVAEISAQSIIDVIQLHGDEDEDYIQRLEFKTGKHIIKAVRVRSRDSIDAALLSSSKYLLLDTYSKNGQGGTGEMFDWGIIPGIVRPFFLAGGLSAANVVPAIEKFRPFGVDVSSGVETDGLKDEQKIFELVQLIRSVS